MTKQETFDIAVRGVILQGGPSVRNTESGRRCVYRGPNGRKCGVGHLISDEYYNPDSDKKKQAEIIIAKHRGGPVGTVNLFFDASLTKFSGLEK